MPFRFSYVTLHFRVERQRHSDRHRELEVKQQLTIWSRQEQQNLRAKMQLSLSEEWDKEP